MRYTVLKAATLALSTLYISGCSTGPCLVETTHQHDAQEKSTMLITVLSELAIDSDFEDSAFTMTGPQLVAGDWIAWQCALAGSYWDMSQTNAPAYAEAHE